MAAPVPDRLFVIIKAPNGDVREVAVGNSRIVVGRDESADVRVEDRKVSRRHAAFVVEDGRLYAEDLGSSNGIRLNGQRVDKRAPVGVSDVVLVGGYEVRLKPGGGREGRSQSSIPADATELKSVGSSPPTVGLTVGEVRKVRERSSSVARDHPVLVGLDRLTEGRRFVLAESENLVGRQEDSAVSVLDGSISRQHARIDVKSDGVYLVDLGSANGVFINGVRIEREMLASGDQIRFGSVNFRLELPTSIPNRVRAPGRRADAKSKGSRKQSRRWLGPAAGLALLLVLGGLGFEIHRRHKETQRRLSLPLPSEPPPLTMGIGDAGVGASSGDAGRGGDASPSPGETATLVLARTATSPFGRRDERGFPIDVPEVDASFDFDGFVSSRLAQAEAFEKEKRYLDLRRTLLEISARDPVNGDVRAMLERVRLAEVAAGVLEKVEQLRQKGELMAAYNALVAIPEGAPQSAPAKITASELRPLAIRSELDRAEREAGDRKSYASAHRRLLALLELEPTNEEALRLIGTLETAMLSKKVRFDAYVPPSDRTAAPAPGADPAAILAARYSDRVMLRVMETYLGGALDQALENARALAKRSKGQRQKEAERLAKTFAAIKAKYQRTRTALGNDPGEAWAHLIELEALERGVLPSPLHSKLVVGLQQGVAEEYARRGDAFFAQSRYEDAFQQWVSASKLQPKNGRALAGLDRLEKVAEKEAPEIDLSAQAGAKDSCERWRRLTRMTRSDSEVYKKAAQRVKVACSR